MAKLPDNWDIYSSMAGSKKANEAISKAATLVAKEMEKLSKEGYDIGQKTTLRLAKEHITPVFDKYEKFGTYDTEPRAIMANYLTKVAEELGSNDGEGIYESIRWEL